MQIGDKRDLLYLYEVALTTVCSLSKTISKTIHVREYMTKNSSILNEINNAILRQTSILTTMNFFSLFAIYKRTNKNRVNKLAIDHQIIFSLVI